MSQIAQALAKAKERTGHTATPFLSAGTSVPPLEASRAAASAAALRRAKTRQRFWLGLALIALPLTGFIFWTQIRDEAVPVPPVASAPTAEAVPAENIRSAPTPASAPAPVAMVSSTPKSAGASVTSAQAANTTLPRPELMQAVNALAISAVMPGDPARIMLAGKVVRAGQNVTDSLVFSGYADGQLRFTDTRGAVYTRYY